MRELNDLLKEMVGLHKRRGVVLTAHMEELEKHVSASNEIETFDEWFEGYDGVGGPRNPEQLARDAWERRSQIQENSQ